MWSLLGRGVRLCDGISRREVLRVGGLAVSGLLWSDWLRARSAASGTGGTFGKAKACILIFNYGGPSHLDTLDLKPDAPAEVRGEFRPIATRIPGIAIAEHLPRLAEVANLYTIVRSVSHIDNDHAVGAYLSLTGCHHPRSRPLGVEPPATPQDAPAMGSVISKVRPAAASMFSYVTLGELRHFGNHDSMGQNAGCLGRAYDPFTVPFVRPLSGQLEMSGVTSVLAGVEGTHLHQRRRLQEDLARVAPALESTVSMRNLDGYTRRAFELLSAPASRDAFEVSREPQHVRDRYGPTPFGQNCLLARRLVEAGVPMVTVYSFGNRDWDTHSNNFHDLKQILLPPTDQGVAGLLEDLDQRGLLESTLVLWMGDMGRTPRINGGAGRDHWSFCYSIVVAGAGIGGGRVYGSSDRGAAYPSANPVHPADVVATIYHSLGIDPRTHVADQQGRPLVASTGTPIAALFG